MAVTPEEKLNILRNIPLKTGDVKSFQIELHELLMRDTVDGKLYKYREVHDDNLSCLKDGTLYCPTPDKFNDPFDCKIGYTFSGLYDAKFDTEVDRFEIIFNKYMRVFNGEIALSDCSDFERPFVEKLIRNNRLSTFLKETQGIAQTPEEEAELIKNNPNILLDIISPMAADKKLIPDFGIMSTMIPKIVQNIQQDDILKLSEDKFSLDALAAANGITDDTDEIGKVMLLSQRIAPEKKNEMASIQNIINKGETTVSNRMVNLFRVGCLATDYKNRLMWAHYANSHKGYCIEYDFSGMDDYTLENLPFPVVYSTERPQIPWKAVIDNTSENIREGSVDLMVGLLTKDSAWKYENEWRILIPGKSNPCFKMPSISCIYLGASISKKHEDQITEIAKEKNIPIKRMSIDRGLYELHAHEI